MTDIHNCYIEIAVNTLSFVVKYAIIFAMISLNYENRMMWVKEAYRNEAFDIGYITTGMR